MEYKLIDIDDERITENEELTEEVLFLACRRQGYAPKELFPVADDTVALPNQQHADGSETELPQSMQSIIKKHSEGRRRAKIDSVICEALHVLESGGPDANILRPHKSLAAADSQVLLRNNGIVKNSGSSKKLFRKMSSVFLSAGGSVHDAKKHLGLPLEKEKGQEETPNTDEDFEIDSGSVRADEAEVEEFVLPEGIEIPSWLDIDGDGEISQEEFEVFRKELLRAEKLKKQQLRDINMLHGQEAKAKRIEDRAAETKYKMDKKMLEWDLERRRKMEKRREKKQRREKLVQEAAEKIRLRQEEYRENLFRQEMAIKERDAERKSKLKQEADRAMRKRQTKTKRMIQKKQQIRRDKIQLAKERAEKVEIAKRLRESIAMEKKMALSNIAERHERKRKEKIARVHEREQAKKEMHYSEIGKKDKMILSRLQSHAVRRKEQSQKSARFKERKQQARRESLTVMHSQRLVEGDKIKQQILKKENQVLKRKERAKAQNLERQVKKQLRIKEKRENIERDKRLKKYQQELLHDHIYRQEEQFERTRVHKEELLKHRKKQRVEAWREYDKMKNTFRLLKISNKGHNLAVAATGGQTPRKPTRPSSNRVQSKLGLESPLVKRSAVSPRAKNCNCLNPIDRLALSPRAALALKPADLSPYKVRHDISEQYFTTEDQLRKSTRKRKLKKMGRKRRKKNDLPPPKDFVF